MHVINKSRLSAHKKAIGLFLLAFVCAVFAQLIEYPYQRIDGNMCDNPPHGYCYELGYKVGVPLAWMWGSTVSAATGSNDEHFVVNVAILTPVLFFFFRGMDFVVSRIRERRKLHGG